MSKKTCSILNSNKTKQQIFCTKLHTIIYRKWNSRIRRSVESESTGNNELVCGTFVPEGAEFQFFLETLVKQQSLNLDLASIRNDENIPVYKCFSENEITNPIM